MTDTATYLRGYVTGYWEGFDFARAEPTPTDAEVEGEGEAGSATGGADASSPAPALDPVARCASAASTPDGAEPTGSSASAGSSLPAIRQLALPEDVDVAGMLEGLYIHRGMVLGIHMMVEIFEGLGMTESAFMCRLAIATAREELGQAAAS